MECFGVFVENDYLNAEFCLEPWIIMPVWNLAQIANSYNCGERANTLDLCKTELRRVTSWKTKEQFSLSVRTLVIVFLPYALAIVQQKSDLLCQWGLLSLSSWRTPLVWCLRSLMSQSVIIMMFVGGLRNWKNRKKKTWFSFDSSRLEQKTDSLCDWGHLSTVWWVMLFDYLFAGIEIEKQQEIKLVFLCFFTVLKN